MAANKRIRMGMIGGGEGAFIGAVHRHAAGMDGHYELVCGAFSRDPGNNSRTADSLNVRSERAYESWETMLQQEQALPSDERMEVVVIVTPNHLHVPISLAAAKAGFHVFCEKPAASSYAEACDLQDAMSGANVLYGLAHTYIGYPMVWQARNMVVEGKIGQVRKILVEYPQGWLSAEEETSNKQASWRTDPALAGASGCMGDIGTHAFGLAEFVSGDKITTLCADLNTHINGRRLDDDGAALFKTASGASGVLIASQVCAGEENALTVRVYGDKGGLEWHQMEPNSLIYRPAGEPLSVYRAGLGQPGLCEDAISRCRIPGGHPEGYLEAMANLYTWFAKALKNGHTGTAQGVPGMSSGVRGMAFIQAMLDSADSDKKWHAVPERNEISEG